jgi:hypothetical protein
MISPDSETQMRAALAGVEAAAERAEQAAPDLLGGWWGSLIGAGSTVEAARELARQFRRDADRLRERFNALVSSATATDDEAREFVRDATGAAGGIVLLEAVSAEVSGDVGAVLGETAGEVADLFRATGRPLRWALENIGPVIGVVGLAAAVLVVRDLRRAAR